METCFDVEKNQNKSVEYYDGNVIKEICEQAVLEGEMFEKYDQYYFTIPVQETFEPEFPPTFDTLIIEHFDSKWVIPRNKTIDRFIRKSKRICKEIDKSKNKYILRFMSDGKEVYSIPYDDIGYPIRISSARNFVHFAPKEQQSQHRSFRAEVGKN